MIAVTDLVDAVGASLLQLLVEGGNANGQDGSAIVEDVTLAEPALDIVGVPGDLVLGVGISDALAAVSLLERAAQSGAGGVVLKPPVATDTQVVAAAERLNIALVELAPHSSWAHVVWLLRGVLDRAGAPGSPLVGDAGVHSDLFALADAAAGIVDAPVTIEDAQSRVLAYSSRQDLTDPARVSTIIGRRVPEEIVSHLRARGVFRKLARSSDPIYVTEGPNGTLPRLVIPVRAGGEWLGSIWAVVTGPVPEEQVRELTHAASVLALHLLRLRAQAGAARRVSADRLRAVLRSTSPEAERQTNISLPDGPWRVVALGAVGTSDGEGAHGAPAGAADLRRQLDLWESMAHRFGWQQPLLTDLDGIPLAVVTANGTVAAAGTAGSWAWLVALVEEVHPQDTSLFAAAGGPATSLAGLPRSRSEAVELSLLLVKGRLAGPTCRLEDAWDTVTLARAGAAVRVESELLGGPLPAILAHDAEHGTDYRRTLALFLDHFGEPQRAAQALHVHPNTLRYRMHRLADVVAIDFGSPQVRLALRLQLAALD